MARLTPIHWKRLEKVFLAAGFVFARQEGSHRSYSRAGTPRPTAPVRLKQHSGQA